MKDAYSGMLANPSNKIVKFEMDPKTHTIKTQKIKTEFLRMRKQAKKKKKKKKGRKGINENADLVKTHHFCDVAYSKKSADT
jgi:hypothetical protein